MGRFDRGFVVDRDATVQIWNQPLRSYKVIHQQSMTASEAMGLFHSDGDTYVFNPEAAKLIYLITEIKWIHDFDPEDGGLTYNGKVSEYTIDQVLRAI